MKVAVIGASGRTGLEVVGQALERGHDVTAVARRPDVISLRDGRLRTGAADVLNQATLDAPLAGADAVVSTLGSGTSRAATTVYSEGITNVLAAMDKHAVSRLAVISAAPVGPRAQQPFLERRIAMPILDHIFGATYADMRLMERILAHSDVDWISLRPPRLVDKAATGRYRIDADRPLPKFRRITYPDLATALLDSLERQDLYRRAVFVAN